MADGIKRLPCFWKPFAKRYAERLSRGRVEVVHNHFRCAIGGWTKKFETQHVTRDDACNSAEENVRSSGMFLPGHAWWEVQHKLHLSEQISRQGRILTMI